MRTSPLQRMTSLQRNCLTGPHTFIASSFTSTHFPCGSSVETNAIKASVPKLFNCPVSRFPRPLSRAGQRCGVSAALRTYNIVGSLLTSVASDTDNSSSRSHWPCPALSPLGSRAVHNHNTTSPPTSNYTFINGISRLASTGENESHH